MTTASKQRSRIIDAARERVKSGGGIPALTLREVAATADLPLGSLRHVFPSKDALFVALAEDVVEAARERQRLAMREESVLDKIVMLLPQGAAGHHQARLEMMMGLHAADVTLSEPVRHAFVAASNEFVRLGRVTCEHVVQLVTGTHEDLLPRVDAVAFHALVEGLQFQMISGRVELHEVLAVLKQHLQVLARKR